MPNAQTQLLNLCICVYSKFSKHLHVLSSIREVLNYDIGQYSLANGVGDIRSDQTVNH